jgi:peptidoglycan/xylan/chitin deacetylase (PgdA/CDA1 family)
MVRPVLHAVAAVAAVALLGCASRPVAAPKVAPAPSVVAPAPEAPVPSTAAPEAAPPPLPAVPLPPVPLPPEAATTSSFREPVVSREETRVVVLEYHAIGDFDDPLFLSAKDFEGEVRWLLQNHVEIVRTSDLLAFLDGEIELPRRVAVITLDDAHKSARRVVLPMLQRLGVPFTLALNTAAIEEHGVGAMDWDDVKAVVDSGLAELASHGHSHAFMARLTDDKNAKELELSRDLIEAHTGVRPATFVFPFGSHDARLDALTEKEGYRAAFAAWGPPVHFGSKRFSLGRFGVVRATPLAAFAYQFKEPAKGAAGIAREASAVR